MIVVTASADRIFVRQGLAPLIEAEGQPSLLMATDIQPGRLTWSEDFLINPFQVVDDGSLCDAALRPGLVEYFERKIAIRRFSALMRRGSIRYQAQVLRKLRMSASSSLTTEVKQGPAKVSGSSVQTRLDQLPEEPMAADRLGQSDCRIAP